MTDVSLVPPRRVAIIGAGLLGGSFGLAVKKYWSAETIIGVSRSAESRDEAIRSGAVTETTDDIEAACTDADWVIVSVPVGAISGVVVRASRVCDPSGLIVDLGSTKSSIVRAIDDDEIASSCYVGTHPIAGSEKTGAAHASADLFVGKPVVITPGSCTPAKNVDRVEAVWQMLGGSTTRMTPEAHDEVMAVISHVPHLAASMMAALLPRELAPLVGSGWLDTTRVASGDPAMWVSICRENAGPITRQIAISIRWMQTLASAIERNDFEAVRQLLAEAKSIRDAARANVKR